MPILFLVDKQSHKVKWLKNFIHSKSDHDTLIFSEKLSTKLFAVKRVLVPVCETEVCTSKGNSLSST